MRTVRGSGDDDHVLALQKPGKRQGCGLHAKSGRQLAQTRVRQKTRLLDRRVGHERNLPLLAPGQQIPFDPAPCQVIEDLVGGDGVSAGLGTEFFHVVRIEVADTPVTNLALRPEFLETFNGLGQRELATPVQKIKIKAINTKALQAAFAGGHQGTAAGIVRIDLADQENLGAPSFDGFADQLFRGAFAVHFGGINQGHAEINAALQGGNFFGTTGAVVAKHPGAHAEGRDFFARRQGDGLHQKLLYSLAGI